MIEVQLFEMKAKFNTDKLEWTSKTHPFLADLLNMWLPKDEFTVDSIYYDDGKITDGFEVKGQDAIALLGFEPMKYKPKVIKYEPVPLPELEDGEYV